MSATLFVAGRLIALRGFRISVTSFVGCKPLAGWER